MARANENANAQGSRDLNLTLHGIQPGRGQFTGLAARQERNHRNCGGDCSQQTPHRGVGYLVHRFLILAGQSRKRHVGLQDHSLQRHTLSVQLVENCSLDFFRYLKAPLQGVLAVHEHFRLDDEDQSGFLAQRGFALLTLALRLRSSDSAFSVTKEPDAFSRNVKSLPSEKRNGS